MAILKKMSDYVDAQQSIALLFESDTEVITPQLQNLQFSSSGQVLLDRPNNIHVTRHGGYADVYFDGKQGRGHGLQDRDRRRLRDTPAGQGPDRRVPGGQPIDRLEGMRGSYPEGRGDGC